MRIRALSAALALAAAGCGGGEAITVPKPDDPAAVQSRREAWKKARAGGEAESVPPPAAPPVGPPP